MAKFCPYCGSPVKESDKFCIICGKPLLTDLPKSQESIGRIDLQKEEKKLKNLLGEGLERRDRSHIGDVVIIPIRCFTCGKVIGEIYDQYKVRYDEYKKSMEHGEKPKEIPKDILDDLGVERYCCRRMIITHVDLIGESAPYE